MHGCIRKKKFIGVTLVELIVVVSILSLLTLIAIPSSTTKDSYQLDLAINEISYAIRYARTEAIRSNNVYGVDIDQSSQQITVYKANLSTNPASMEFIVLHPVNKQPYDYNLVADLNLANVQIDDSLLPFLYKDGARRKSLLFDGKGIPLWIETSTNTQSLLSSSNISLQLGSAKKSILVEPYHGRVTIQ
ncbi:MAG: prepilin-type N-terminal cleavage/methylation domain-containing protein [Gammaproteobacteria bacterium]